MKKIFLILSFIIPMICKSMNNQHETLDDVFELSFEEYLERVSADSHSNYSNEFVKNISDNSHSATQLNKNIEQQYSDNASEQLTFSINPATINHFTDSLSYFTHNPANVIPGPNSTNINNTQHTNISDYQETQEQFSPYSKSPDDAKKYDSDSDYEPDEKNKISDYESDEISRKRKTISHNKQNKRQKNDPENEKNHAQIPELNRKYRATCPQPNCNAPLEAEMLNMFKSKIRNHFIKHHKGVNFTKLTTELLQNFNNDLEGKCCEANCDFKTQYCFCIKDINLSLTQHYRLSHKKPFDLHDQPEKYLQVFSQSVNQLQVNDFAIPINMTLEELLQFLQQQNNSND